MSDTLSDTKERQAISRVINGEPAQKVANEIGIPRQTLSTWVAGVRHFKVDTLAMVSDTSKDCSACQTVLELTEQVKHLSDTQPVSDSLEAGDTTAEVGPCSECQTLGERVQELETLNASFQTEVENLQAEITALKETATASAPEPATAPEPEGEGNPPGVYSYAQVKAWELDMQAIIDGRDSEIGHLRSQLERLKKGYIVLRQMVQPGWKPGMPTTLRGVQVTDMEKRFSEMQELILSTSPEELRDAVRRMQKDGHYPAGFQVHLTEKHRQEMKDIADRIPEVEPISEEFRRPPETGLEWVRRYNRENPSSTGPDFDSTPLTMKEIREEKEKAKASPELGMTTMNAEAQKLAEKMAVPVEENMWPPVWLPGPVAKFADKIFEKIGMN